MSIAYHKIYTLLVACFMLCNTQSMKSMPYKTSSTSSSKVNSLAITKLLNASRNNKDNSTFFHIVNIAQELLDEAIQEDDWHTVHILLAQGNFSAEDIYHANPNLNMKELQLFFDEIREAAQKHTESALTDKTDKKERMNSSLSLAETEKDSNEFIIDNLLNIFTHVVAQNKNKNKAPRLFKKTFEMLQAPLNKQDLNYGKPKKPSKHKDAEKLANLVKKVRLQKNDALLKKLFEQSSRMIDEAFVNNDIQTIKTILFDGNFTADDAAIADPETHPKVFQIFFEHLKLYFRSCNEAKDKAKQNQKTLIATHQQSGVQKKQSPNIVLTDELLMFQLMGLKEQLENYHYIKESNAEGKEILVMVIQLKHNTTLKYYKTEAGWCMRNPLESNEEQQKKQSEASSQKTCPADTTLKEAIQAKKLQNKILQEKQTKQAEERRLRKAQEKELLMLQAQDAERKKELEAAQALEKELLKKTKKEQAKKLKREERKALKASAQQKHLEEQENQKKLTLMAQSIAQEELKKSFERVIESAIAKLQKNDKVREEKAGLELFYISVKQYLERHESIDDYIDASAINDYKKLNASHKNKVSQAQLTHYAHTFVRRVREERVCAAAREGNVQELKKWLPVTGNTHNLRGYTWPNKPEEDVTPLEIAYKRGHSECVNTLREHHARINGAVKKNTFPEYRLYVAAKEGSFGQVKGLVDQYGHNPHLAYKDDEGNDALGIAQKEFGKVIKQAVHEPSLITNYQHCIQYLYYAGKQALAKQQQTSAILSR